MSAIKSYCERSPYHRKVEDLFVQQMDSPNVTQGALVGSAHSGMDSTDLSTESVIKFCFLNGANDLRRFVERLSYLIW